MRHFGHSIGHLLYKRQQLETEPNSEMADVESSDSDMVYSEDLEDKQDGNDNESTGANLEDDEVGNSDVDDNDGESEADSDDCHWDSDGGESVKGGYRSF